MQSIDIPTERNNDVTILAKGAGIALIGRVIGRGFVLIGQLVLARILGPELFGLYAIGWTMILMGERVASLGLEEGVIRYATPETRANLARLKGVLFQAFLLALGSGSIIGIMLYLAAPFVATHLFDKSELTIVIRWFVPTFSISAGLQVAAAATRVSKRMQFSIIAQDLMQPVMNLVLISISFILGLGLLGAIGALIISYCVALVFAVIFVRRLFPEVFSSMVKPISVAREMIGYSILTSLSRLFATFTFWVDRFFVGIFLPLVKMGIYQAASQLSTLFGLILNALNAILSPMIADLYSHDKLSRLNELYKISTKWAIYASLPFFLIICFVPREIMIVLIDKGYSSGAKPLIILAIAQMVNTSTGSVGVLLIMTGHQTKWLKISICAFLCNLVVSMLLIPEFGFVGGAISNAISIVGLFIGGLIVVHRDLGLWPYDRRIYKGLLAACITALLLFIFNFFFQFSPIIKLICNASISLFLFLVILLVQGLDVEDREFLRRLHENFKKLRFF